MPPALVLSQDQTLHSDLTHKEICDPFLSVALASHRALKGIVLPLAGSSYSIVKELVLRRSAPCDTRACHQSALICGAADLTSSSFRPSSLLIRLFDQIFSNRSLPSSASVSATPSVGSALSYTSSASSSSLSSQSFHVSAARAHDASPDYPLSCPPRCKSSK